MLPSEAHEYWFNNAWSQVILIQRNLMSQGLLETIKQPVSVEALFYRDRESGDLTGYMQALADFMQETKILPSGKVGRRGVGIITDDKLIVSWDGSRLRKDAVKPRIEVKLQVWENYKS